MPREGAITASVALIPRDGLTKVRVTIWSGPDFRTPTIVSGAMFENDEAARYVADEAIEALELLGIPVEGTPNGHETRKSLLPQIGELQDIGDNYPVVRE